MAQKVQKPQKAKAIGIKTYVTSDDGNTYLIDTIEHEGSLWLVPKWLPTPYPQMQKPARIIQMLKHKLQNLGVESQTHLHLYRLDGPVSKAALDGATAPQ